MLDALTRLLPEAELVDIATGYFQVGAFPLLGDAWRSVHRIRLLMGDEQQRKTKSLFVSEQLESDVNGIEAAKEADDWGALDGLEAVRNAVQTGQIEARVYTRAKFHAKAYYIHGTGQTDYALVGSSNFTRPGLTQNLELNMLTKDDSQIEKLKEWYERAWEEAEEVRHELIRVIEPHIREYTPFEVYLRAMRQFFFAQDPPETTWETSQSRIYPLLATYQRDAYHSLRKIAGTWGGALLCDGVGLGKTYVALMLIERALKDGKRVLVLSPKSTIDSLWHPILKMYFPDDYHEDVNLPRNIVLVPHTDLGIEGKIKDEDIPKYRASYGTIVVDEAHHFRVPRRNRSQKLRKLSKGKELYLLTATPINNSILDLYWLMQYFVQDDQKKFADLGVANLRAWFKKREEELADGGGEDAIIRDELLRNVLVQRSRRFVKALERAEDTKTKFPKRQPPQVIEYSLRDVYAGLLPRLKRALDSENGEMKLVLYETEKFKAEQDPAYLQEQSNVVGLVRTMLLKRLESSYKALEASIEDLLFKHIQALRFLSPERCDDWEAANAQIIQMMRDHRSERENEEGTEDEEDDFFALTERREQELAMLRRDVAEFGENEGEWFSLLVQDMNVLGDLLSGIYENLRPNNDAKLKALVDQLKSDPRLSKNKVILFSEFKDTARYLERELKRRLPERASQIVEVDSGRNVKGRAEIIKRFAPYYNTTGEDIERLLAAPIDLLITTDVLSEGLNLQDANLVVNYDLHWNPVRLMQRIGRVDRRMDTSKQVAHDEVWVFNFLPPDDLDDLLKLHQRLAHKLNIITMILGMESQVLTPDDYVRTLDIWLEHGEGELTAYDRLRLRAAELARDHRAEWEATESFPLRIYSGKAGEPRGMFLCYRLAVPREGAGETDLRVKWYYYDIERDALIEDMEAMHGIIESSPATPRLTVIEKEERTKLRLQADAKGVTLDTYKMQLVTGSKRELLCWMEVN